MACRETPRGPTPASLATDRPGPHDRSFFNALHQDTSSGFQSAGTVILLSRQLFWEQEMTCLAETVVAQCPNSRRRWE